MENEFLKDEPWASSRGRVVAQRCAVIETEKAPSRSPGCRLLGMPRSSFYAWRNRAEARPQRASVSVRFAGAVSTR